MLTLDVIIKILWLSMFPLGGCLIAGIIAMLIKHEEGDEE